METGRERNEAARVRPHFKDERYVEIRALAAGGMGTIFSATDTVLNKEVAIKLLPGHQTWDDAQYVRFQREAQALGKLNHRNIAQINDFGIDEKRQPYMVLELVNGIDLAKYIETHDLNEAQIIEIALQTLAALSHAHSRNVVHRDIKPENIMIVFQDGELIVKLIDFGIAKFVDEEEQVKSLTTKGMIIGSPYYISPEQILKEPVTELSDIYSFGCVLFMLATDCPPFEGESAVEIVNRHLEDDVPLISDVIPADRFSSALEDIIARCLSKDPGDRFQSADEMASAFRKLLERGVESEDLAPPVMATAVPRKTRRSVLIAGIVVIFLLSVASVVASLQNQKVPTPTKMPEATLPKPGANDLSLESVVHNEDNMIRYIGKEADMYIAELKKSNSRLTDCKTRGETIARLSPETIGLLEKQSKLRKLSLLHGSDAELMRLSGLKKLNYIFLNCCDDLSGTAFKQGLWKDTLTGVRISTCKQFDYDSLAALKAYKKLEDVRLEYSTIDRTKLELLSTFEGLKRLQLNDSHIEKDAFPVFAQFTSLKELWLTGTNTSVDDLQYIKPLSQLNRLGLGGCRLSDTTVNDLSRYFKPRTISVSQKGDFNRWYYPK